MVNRWDDGANIGGEKSLESNNCRDNDPIGIGFSICSIMFTFLVRAFDVRPLLSLLQGWFFLKRPAATACAVGSTLSPLCGSVGVR